MNFFDIDRNGESSEKEFMNQLAKAERLLKTSEARKTGGRPGTAGSFRATGTSFGASFNDRDESGMSQYISNFNE